MTVDADVGAVFRRVVANGEDEIECLFIVFGIYCVEFDQTVDMDVRNAEVVEAVHVAEQAVITIDRRIAPVGVALGKQQKRGGVFHALVPLCHLHMGEVDGGHQRVVVCGCVDGIGRRRLVIRQVLGVDFRLVGCGETQKFNTIVFQHMAQFVHHPDVFPCPFAGAVVGPILIDGFDTVVVAEGLGIEQPAILARGDEMAGGLVEKAIVDLVVEFDMPFTEAEVLATVLFRLALVLARGEVLQRQFGFLGGKSDARQWI